MEREILKALCLNNKNKPNDIELSEWLKLNEIYTVEKIVSNSLYNTYSLVLKEIEITNDKYVGYNIDRFFIFNNSLELEIESEIKKLLP